LYSTQRIPLFINPHAGTGPTGADSLRELLGDAVDIEEVAPADLEERIRKACADGHAVVAVAGGDGSLHTAVNALAGSDTALAVIPTGTLNNFAKRLGIENLEDARYALIHGKPSWIALGSVNDELFLNTLTFGEYARTVRLRERMRKWLGKWPAALVAFLRVVATLRLIDVTLNIDGERTITRRTPFLWVGVGLGSFPSVAEAVERRNSPDLEVAILHSRTPLATAGFMWRASLQMLREEYPVRDRALEVFHARDITLTARRHLDGTSDGELVRLDPPIRTGVRDQAVRIMRLESPDS
jgi:diacylglycerol kinase family enzyme